MPFIPLFAQGDCTPGGIVAKILQVPNRNIAIVVLTNNSYADSFGMARQIGETLAEIRLGSSTPCDPLQRGALDGNPCQ